jgi:hypothetical protein
MARQVKSEGTDQLEVKTEPEVKEVVEVKTEPEVKEVVEVEVEPEVKEVVEVEVEPEVKKPTAAVTGKVTKKTRIHCVENVDCIVAGNRYKFPKGKETEVPDDVAAILSSAKKAFRM